MEKVHTTVEVRYQETDQMGVVYHANYLVWFEIGRSKYVESLGFKYADMEEHGVVSPVIDAQITYKKPVTYGQEVKVTTWVKKYNGVRTVYGYEVIDAEEDVAVTGSTEHVIVDKKTFRPLSLRKKFPDWHQAYKKRMKGD